MSVRFKYGGTTWEADTPEEARKLRQQLIAEDQAAWEEGEEPPNQGFDANKERIWTPDLVTDFLKIAGPLQLRFLHVLAEGSSVPSAKVLQHLSLDSEMALAGVLSGLSKQLKKMSLKPWDLYSTFVMWDGKSKNRAFSLGSEFRRSAEELGWPDKWK